MTNESGGRRCSCCGQLDAGHRHACDSCVSSMRTWLGELEDYAAILTAVPTRSRGPGAGSVGGSFGSRLPIDADIATFLDPRSGAGAAVWRLRDPRDMDDEPVRSLPGSIHGIAAWLRDEHDQVHPRRWTLVGELRFLRGRIDACAIEPWIGEVHEDLRELHHQARAFARDVPRPLGHCLTATCEGLVFWKFTQHTSDLPAEPESTGNEPDATPADADPDAHPDAAPGEELLPRERARCVSCGRTYTGLDLVRLGAAEDAAAEEATCET